MTPNETAWREELLTAVAVDLDDRLGLGSLTVAQLHAAVGLAVTFAQSKVEQAVTELTVRAA